MGREGRRQGDRELQQHTSQQAGLQSSYGAQLAVTATVSAAEQQAASSCVAKGVEQQAHHLQHPQHLLRDRLVQLLPS